jgi:peptidoglycan hydrolase-like protein with peptidoglycan-binding domain
VIVAEDGAELAVVEHPNLLQPSSTSPMQSAFTNVDPAVSLDESSETNPSTPAQSAIKAGTRAVGAAAARLQNAAPLRILVTRQTKRDRIIDLQIVLRDLGYLKGQNFDGEVGKPTITAIKAFQKGQGLPATGEPTDDLVKRVFQSAGKAESPEGRLFVREKFREVFSAPITFRDPQQPLGTHLFAAMKFAPGDTKIQWIAMSLEGDDPRAALDRIEIPDDVRQKISERLTPGASLIIAEKSKNSAILPKGGDFLIAVRGKPSLQAEKSTSKSQAKLKQAKSKKTHARIARANKRQRSARYYSYNYPFEVRGRGFFWRLRWR